MNSRRRRQKVMTAALALALCAALASSDAQAGPWSKKWGELYVKLAENFFLSESFRDASGNIVTGTQYSGFTTALYFEVGLPAGFHVWSYLPYTVAINDFDTGNKYMEVGGGDAQMGLQWSPHFLNLPVPLAARLEFKVPFYELSSVSPNFPAPGDGQLDITVWLSAGASLGDIPIWLFGEVGYRHRTEQHIGDHMDLDLKDGIALFVQVGYNFWDKVLLGVNFGGILTFEDDTATKSYLTVGPALYVPVYKGLAVEAGFDPVIYAKNSADGYGFSVGVSYKR